MPDDTMVRAIFDSRSPEYWHRIWDERRHQRQLQRSILAAEQGPILAPLGMAPDEPFERYRRWAAINSSSLGILDHASPAHLQWALQNPTHRETDATIFGSALHMALLEPKRFATAYVVGPEGDGRSSPARDEKALLVKVFGEDVTYLSPAVHDAILNARDQVLAHPAAARLLCAAAHRELSIGWDHYDEDGRPIRCKGRLDMVCPTLRAIADIKTTSDASPQGFADSIRKWHYTRAAAFYLDGLNALWKDGQPFDAFAFIAVESAEPHAVCVYELRIEDIANGRREYRRLLRQYAACAYANRWDSYPSTITYIDLPTGGTF